MQTKQYTSHAQGAGIAAPTPRRPRKRFRLTWRMIQMMLLCWVLPVVVVVLLGGGVLRQSLVEQSVERLSLSVQGGAQLSTLRLENSIIASRSASYIGTIKAAWGKYQTDADQVALYQTSRTFLAQQYESEQKFYSTILLFYDFTSDPIYIINGAAGGTDRVRQDAASIMAKAQAVGETLDTGIAFFAVGERVFMMRNLVDSSYQPIAALMMELNTDLIFAELRHLSNLEFAYATIGDVAVPLTPSSATAGTTLADVQQAVQTKGGQIPVEKGTLGIAYHKGTMHSALDVAGADFTYGFYSVTHPAILNEQWNMVVIMLLLVFVLTLPLGALIFRFFFRHVSTPIQAIIRSTNEIRNQNYGVQLPESAMLSQEMGLLGDNFNQMSTTLQQQFEHIYKEEIALRDARIMALQSQINPHFLNNTLEIINWEARMQGDLKVCNMIESLAIMLNAAMDRRSRHTVSLSEELMYVDAYLYIINERLGKRLVFEKDIPDVFLDARVPRLVLQPILENAVEHGITPVQQGRITLRAVQEGEWLMLCVENDGVITPAQQQRIEALLRGDAPDDGISSNSLGLRNVHQRLRILYGEESGVLVDITKKGLTIFKLKVKLAQE